MQVMSVWNRGRAAQIAFCVSEHEKNCMRAEEEEEQRQMRRGMREMSARKRVRGNTGNNTFTAVEIKFATSAHTRTRTHLQLFPSGWHCVIWHIHFLGWVCFQCCRGSHKPHRGIPANPRMMSLWKHTHWTANKSRLCKSVLLTTVLFFDWCWFFSTEVWTNFIEPVWLQKERVLVFSHRTAVLQFPWSFLLVRHLIMWLFTGQCIPNAVPEATRSAPASSR